VRHAFRMKGKRLARVVPKRLANRSGPQLLLAAGEQLVEQFDGEVDFFAGNGEGRRESKNVLVVSAHVEHQAHSASADFEVSGKPFGKDAVRQFAVGGHAVRL